MDMFILIGAGILGAATMASRSHKPVSTLWKVVFGSIGGAGADLFLKWLDMIPQDPSLSGFIMLFATGAVAGGLMLLLGLYLKRLR